MKRVIVILADGFEQSEALVPHDMLKRAGADVSTVSLGNKKEAVSTHGVKVATDLCLDELPQDDKIDLIVLPGGMPGASNIMNSEQVCRLARDIFERGGLVSAICAAPFVLGRLGLLEGRHATCYPGFEKELKGAIVSDTSRGGKVVRDGNVITASGMGVALKFGAELVTALYDKNTSDRILKGIMCE